ncbi:MAG TPA: hypothetical protein VKB09_02985 [Thermomicrobiales bacterium]|nr:hypothetical protein [Thermomicrobiales bacterium]
MPDDAETAKKIAEMLSRRDEMLALVNDPEMTDDDRRKVVTLARFYNDSAKIEADAHRAQKGMERGCGCLFIGVVFTAIGYWAADPGDSFTVWWGAAAIGAVYLVIGVARYLRVQMASRRLIQRFEAEGDLTPGSPSGY